MMMSKISLCCIMLWISPSQTTIYKEESVQTYFPEPSKGSKYFGYSILIKDNPPRLMVGAPFWRQSLESTFYSGVVFVCEIDFTNNKLNRCSPQSRDFVIPSSTGEGSETDYKNYMGLGSSLTDISENTSVVCGPMWSHKHDGNELRIHGVCLTSRAEPDYLYPFSNQTLQSKKINENDTENTPYLVYGLAGFSAAVTPDKAWLLLGAPGLLYYTGGLARYTITKNQSIDTPLRFNLQKQVIFDHLMQNSYLGYSVDSAVFDPENKEILAISGAPRGSGNYGTVLIFSVSNEHVSLEAVRAELKGSQYGEYFGASLLSVDVNADGRTDLLVGAPLHAFSGEGDCCFEQGIVYVYINRKHEEGWRLELAGTITGSKGAGSRFGSALADLGDVDGDGYSDVAVGAPFEKLAGAAGASGAVYVFRGGADGVRANYSQKLLTDTSTKGFGFSIARAVDIDNNGCRDLAIGVPLGNKVKTYRCSPRLTVTNSIVVKANSFSNCKGYATFPLKADNFTVQLCVQVAKTKYEWTNATIQLRRVIYKNGKLLSNEPSVVTISPMNANECTEMIINKQEMEDKLHLEFKLEELPQNYETYGSFDKRRADLSEDSLLSSEVTAFFVDCGTDLSCNPDLRFIRSIYNRAYVLGSTDRLGFEMTLYNAGDPAFGTVFQVVIPNATVFKRTDAGCTVTGNIFECNFELLSKKDGKQNWQIELEPTSDFKEGPVNISYTLRDCDKIVKQESFVINVERRADISIKSRVNAPIYTSQADVDSKIPLKFTHHFDILNKGPSDYPEVIVDLEIPSEVNFYGLKNTGCEIKNGTFVRCQLHMKTGQRNAVTIDLPFDLPTKSLETLLHSGKNLTTKATLSYGNLNKTSEAVTQIFAEARRAKPWWVILLAILAGLLIIAIIVYIMYRFGFFVRSMKEEMNEHKSQKSSSDKQGRRHSSTALSVSIENLVDDVDLDNDDVIDLGNDDVTAAHAHSDDSHAVDSR